MTTKLDCPTLEKVADDEPIFVLRAQDILAAPLVRSWARRAISNGVAHAKVAGALRIAEEMDEWAATEGNTTKVPD